MRKHQYRQIALILLMGFIFNFAHSELGFMVPQGDDSHSHHDYCSLVKNANTNSALSTHSVTASIEHQFFAIVPFLIEKCELSGCLYSQMPDMPYAQSGIPDTPLFVINRALLI